MSTSTTMTDAAIGRIGFQAYSDASVYTRLLQSLRPGICPMAKLLSQIPYGSMVLDVGCGAGLFLLAAALDGRIVGGVGVDANARAVICAQKALGRLRAQGALIGIDLRFQQGGGGVALPVGTFDVVSVIDVMHHVAPTNQQVFFRAVAGKVRPGGLLIYKDMCSRPWWRASANRLHDLVLARQWIHYVPVQEVKRWAIREALQVVVQESYQRLVYGHELLLFRRSDATSQLS